jgi:hypothetical protein
MINKKSILTELNKWFILRGNMIENLTYPIIGFVTAYLGLELAWHYSVCRLLSKEIKPCLFKQIKCVVRSSGGVARG